MLDWRECRHCGLEFFPKKAFYWYCSWRCYEADHEDRNDGSPGSIWQAAYDSGYRDGRADGLGAAANRARCLCRSGEGWSVSFIQIYIRAPP
jgi:hypothetical protein